MTLVSWVLGEYRRNLVRTGLVFASLVIAFLLFGVLHGVNAGLDYVLNWLSADSLRVQSRVGIRQTLPLAYLEQIESIPGVRGVTYATFSPAYFQREENGVGLAAMSADRLMVYPHLQIPEAQRQAMAAQRDGAVVGRKLMEKYGWTLGQRVPLRVASWERDDDASTWDFQIVGVYDMEGNADLANEFYVNLEYVDEVRKLGRGTVNLYTVRVDDPDKALGISRLIDQKFANSPAETLTQRDREWVGARLRQVADTSLVIHAILAAVIFVLAILIRNLVAESVRERVAEFATLRAIGFSYGWILGLLLAETVLLCVFGRRGGTARLR
ncbi:MAG: ABC transporter permease [Gammaproteobacteria bacterium]